jgi:putative (di)nucleoside polyphosphate hydrolase
VEEKKYRPNVAAVVVSSKYPEKCEVFIAKRNDIPDAWQFPQGGIDDGESPKEALFRELEEEIGTKDVEIVGKFPGWITYDFPPSISAQMPPYHGQKQQYFLVRLKRGTQVNIKDVEAPEFSEFKFIDVNSVLEQSSHFKRPIYKRILSYFRQEGYLLC